MWFFVDRVEEGRCGFLTYIKLEEGAPFFGGKLRKFILKQIVNGVDLLCLTAQRVYKTVV